MSDTVTGAGSALRADAADAFAGAAVQRAANGAAIARSADFGIAIRTLHFSVPFIYLLSLKRARGRRFPVTTRSIPIDRKTNSIERVVGIVTLIADRAPSRAALITSDRSAFFAALKAVHADSPAMGTIHDRLLMTVF